MPDTRLYLVRLDYDREGSQDEHGEVHCLVRAKSADESEEPLRRLLERLRRETDALSDVKALFVVEIIELPEEPKDAVLSMTSWRHANGVTSSISASLLIDDSGQAAAYGVGSEDGESAAPFMEFEPSN